MNLSKLHGVYFGGAQNKHIWNAADASSFYREDRIKLMLAVSEEAAQDAENNGSTPTSLGSLRTTATQMLEDMESHDIVIDRFLRSFGITRPLFPSTIQAKQCEP